MVSPFISGFCNEINRIGFQKHAGVAEGIGQHFLKSWLKGKSPLVHALSSMAPGAAIGGILGTTQGATKKIKDPDERMETVLRSALLGALTGSAISSGVMQLGRGAAARYVRGRAPFTVREMVEQGIVPGATVGALTGGGMGAVKGEEGHKARAALKGAITGGLTGGALGVVPYS